MIKHKEYTLFILLLAFSTFEFFFRSDILIFILYAFAGFIFILIRKKSIDRWISIVFVVFISSYILQTILVEAYTITFFLSQALSLFGTFFLAYLIKDKFAKVFVNTVYWISIISLVFYFTSYIPSVRFFFMNEIAPSFVSLNVERAVFLGGGINIVIYNYLGESAFFGDFFRNSGPFWEPGMFAVFLSLALFVNNFIEKSKIKTCNIILILSLVTTMSAGGYVAGLVILVFYVFKDNRINVFSLIVVSVAVFYLYNELIDLEFIGQKITYQLTYAEIGHDRSRLGALLTQIEMIEASPLIGGEEFSKFVVSEYGTLASGTLLPFVVHGIPLGLFYFWMLLKSSLKWASSYERRKINGFFFFLLIVILSFSQTILLSTFVFTIMFIGLLKSKKEKHAQF